MSTNKDKIIRFIQDETAKSIQDNIFTFEKCNALIISMELFLDRSNVSRTLNELHRSGVFIKKTGRPATYISKEILNSRFPFASFPETLPKDTKIEDYLIHPTNLSEQSATKSISIIGSQKGGSLYEIVNQMFPVFYLPKNYFRLVILKGMSGTGKKYFLREILERAKQMQLAKMTSDLYFLEYQMLKNNFFETLSAIQKKEIYILNIDFSNYLPAEQELTSFVKSLELYYENQSELPIVTLTLPGNFDSSVLNEISPIVLSFPSIDERPETEIIQLILSIIQQESVRLAKNISISIDFLRLLLSNAQNCHQLKQEILYSISKSLFSSYTQGELYTLYLDSQFLSEDFERNHSHSMSYALRHFPDTITLNPSDPHDFSTDFSNLPSIFGWENTQDFELSDHFARNFMLCDVNTVTSYTRSYSNDRINSSIKQLFSKTVFSMDSILLDQLCMHITSVLKHDINIRKLSLPETNYHLPLVEKLQHLAEHENLEFLKIQEKYLSLLLHYCEDLLKGVQIPIIVASRHPFTANNYVNLINLHYNKRWLYFFPIQENSTNEKQKHYLNDLYQFSLQLNRGHGVLILSDDDIKNTISNYFFPKTKLVTYCISLHSFIILKHITKLLTEYNSSVFSIIPNILIYQQNELSLLKKDSLKSYTLRAADENLLFAGKLMPGINLIHINEYFFAALKQIVKSLDIDFTNNRIIEFLFHGDCLFFQRKYHMNFYENITVEENTIDPDLMDILQSSVNSVPELKKLEFTKKEYAALYQALVYSGI